MVGASDAKISATGRACFIRDVWNSFPPCSGPDASGSHGRRGPRARRWRTTLAMTYGPAISDDGGVVVYAGDTATVRVSFSLRWAINSARRSPRSKRDDDVPLHPPSAATDALASPRAAPFHSRQQRRPHIGFTRLTFLRSVRAVHGAPRNATALWRHRVVEVISSLSDDGSVVAFNFPRALSNRPLIRGWKTTPNYVTGTASRPSPARSKLLTALVRPRAFDHRSHRARQPRGGNWRVSLAFTTEQRTES